MPFLHPKYKIFILNLRILLNMVKNKLRIMTQNLIPDLEEHQNYGTYSTLSNYRIDYSKFGNLLILAAEQIPELKIFLEEIYAKRRYLSVSQAIDSCKYVLEILGIDDAIQKDIEEGKIFQGAKDTLNAASLSFERGDYPGTINNSNTCLELLLKEKFKIPTTIKDINTAKIIEIAIKHKAGPIKYFEEAKKHVLAMDNQIKHRGYTPSKTECIFAIKIMEELCQNLEGYQITLTDEITKKIYSGV